MEDTAGTETAENTNGNETGNENRVSPFDFDWIELKEEDRDLLTAWMDATSENLSDVVCDLRTARDDLQGKYDSERACWQELVDEFLENDGIKLPAWLQVDYEATWEANLRHDYSTSDHNGDFWVFRNN